MDPVSMSQTEYELRGKDMTHQQREELLDELDGRVKLEALDLVTKGLNPDRWIAHTRTLSDLILTHKSMGVCTRLEVAPEINGSLPDEVEDCTWQRCPICTPSKFQTLPSDIELMTERTRFGVAELLRNAAVVINRVQWRGERITITKHGRPVALIVPYSEEMRDGD